MKRASQIASMGRAIEAMAVSSEARSSGMVGTATAPAFSTASQQAASQGLFGPRSRTRLPGTTPSRSVSTRAIWSVTARSSP